MSAPAAATERISSPVSHTARRVALFGLFGIQNLGNECTLQAMLHNVRERRPATDLYTICYVPRDAVQRHAIPAVPVSSRHSTEATARGAGASAGRRRRWLRILSRRIPGELRDWVRAVRTLRRTDLLVMTGTGMLTDYNCGASGFPYDVFRWTVAARLAGCRVCFVSIGVGPLHQRLSRRFVRWALGLAHYRSYRDHLSKSRLEAIGFDTTADPIVPDLAFSFPRAMLPDSATAHRRQRVIGLGVMHHVDPRAAERRDPQESYRRYLSAMADFTTWLLDRGYGVRILQGDARHDGAARRDLRETLERRGVSYAVAGILDDDSTSVAELLAQLALTDVVVSPRFHNLVLGLLLNKPVMSISYDPKNDALLTGFGLGRYCQRIDAVDVDRLIEDFLDLERACAGRLPEVRARTVEYQALLDEQYRLVLANL